MFVNTARIVCSLASALALGAAGCRGGGGSDLMPMELGKAQTYVVKAGFETYVEPIKVTRELSVANTKGYELVGSLGVSRLAWVGDALVAEKLINTQFVPPLPLLYKADETHERPWKGRVVFADRGSVASATQSQTPDDDLGFGGKKIHCTRSVVTLKTATRQIELITWFSQGLGIVQQEQRTDGTLLVKLTLLDDK